MNEFAPPDPLETPAATSPQGPPSPPKDGTAPKLGWRFEHSYARLPAALFASVAPTPVRSPKAVLLNRPLARELGLDPSLLAHADTVAAFAGNRLPDGAQPIAQAYAGHQFGHFTMLGDGRAVLLGEQRTPTGALRDVQLKGSGPTPYSRRGDGRAALGPMLREYIVSEAMHALGIPTTRSLAVVVTGEPVFRGGPLDGAILTRIASSHIRVGTFEFAARQDSATLRALADYTIARHYPEIDCTTATAASHGAGTSGSAGARGTDAARYVAFLSTAMERQARLVAQWLHVGFIHGVMNTDNMALSGETIDYGPCAFLDAYDPATVFSSIDHRGRYAYGNQPAIAQWNLARLAEALLPLLGEDEARAVAAAEALLSEFPSRFQAHYLSGMAEKLGLATAQPDDGSLVSDLLAWMKDTSADYTSTFRALAQLDIPVGEAYEGDAFRAWHRRWRTRLASEAADPAVVRERLMKKNPAVIPRNAYVEEALSAAVDRGDIGPTEALLAAVTRPFEANPEAARFAEPPPKTSEPYVTFCGT